mmetsp:Transcript_20401/g.50733  ORF Transcript_20401/g.50733 Transcript_20401/m.50733 type:complete len:216 (+) Transcript_20401:82-729(+)
MSAPSSKALSPSMTRDASTLPALARRRASYAVHPGQSLSSSMPTLLPCRLSSASAGESINSAGGTPANVIRLLSRSNDRSRGAPASSDGIEANKLPRASTVSSRKHAASSGVRNFNLFLATDSRSRFNKPPISGGSSVSSLPSSDSASSFAARPTHAGSGPISALSSKSRSVRWGSVNRASHATVGMVRRLWARRMRVTATREATAIGTAVMWLP